MQELAKELGVVIPVSFFEEANNAHYNSIAIIDADGTDLGLYRKSHIPDGPVLQRPSMWGMWDHAVLRTKVSYSYDLKGCKRQVAECLENDERGHSFSTHKGGDSEERDEASECSFCR
ncbi:N-carbamoylputrescine amidase isoform X2, partial [Tanacetum coccineum]